MRAILLAATLILPAGLASAASHREAPMISIETSKTGTISDFYAYQGDHGSAAIASTKDDTGPIGSVGAVGTNKGSFGASFGTSNWATSPSVNN